MFKHETMAQAFAQDVDNVFNPHNKNIFKGVTLHLSARIIAWLPAPAEIE
jgi:hypothetical protein